MAESSIDPDQAIAVLSKTQSIQKQRIAELRGEVVQLRDENEQLAQRVQQLEQLLTAHNIALPPPSTAARAHSPVASTQPLSVTVSPMEEEKQQARSDNAQPDATASSTIRMTRSRTRNSLSQPALLRDTTADALLKEISQQEKEGPADSTEQEEEKDATGRKRKKPSAGERSVDKKAKQHTDGSGDAAMSPQQPPTAAEVEALLEQARIEKYKGSTEFGRGLRCYPQALEHYQNALDMLAARFPDSIAVSHYPVEVADLCASLHHKVGVIQNKRGDFDAACSHFDAALQWQPDWWRLWKALGYSEFARKHYPQALEALQRAVRCGVDERKDRVDLEEKIELARSIINKQLTTPLPQQRQVDISPCRSPVPKAQPSTNTSTPARLAGRFDRADGRQPLGEVTNTTAAAASAATPATPASQPAKPHSSDKWLLQLPLITKDGIRDLLGRETFAVAGELHENKRFMQFMADKGGIVRGRTREVEKKRTRLVEQMCRFEGDRCVEYRCQCMAGQEKDDKGEFVQKPPQEKVRVDGSAEEVWRYAACEHIGAMLLTLQTKQQALLYPTTDKENAGATLTPSKRAALASSHPNLYVTPAHHLSTADEQRDRTLAARYEAMKSDELKAALKANDSKTSANVKAELVARCVEEELWGVPDKCSVCKHGNMYYAGGVWRCRGMFDHVKKQYVRCDHVAKDWPTRPWRRV